VRLQTSNLQQQLERHGEFLEVMPQEIHGESQQKCSKSFLHSLFYHHRWSHLSEDDLTFELFCIALKWEVSP
jgi:hypothetical protein